MNAYAVNWSIFEERMVFLMLITNYGLRNAAMVKHIDILKGSLFNKTGDVIFETHSLDYVMSHDA